MKYTAMTVLNSETKKNLILLPFALFLGLVWMLGVPAPHPGLDASWQIALTKAHEEGFQWGEDIIFTYGPFGYLFAGSLVGENFFEMQLARCILSFSWVFFSLKYILSLERALLKGIGIICLILLPSLTFGFRIESSFWILIQLVILDLANLNNPSAKSQPTGLRIYFYGVLGTFLMLVKFSFGVLSVVGFTLAISITTLWQVYKKRNLEASILQPITWLLFGYFVSLATFFSPLVATPMVAILVAILIGVLFTQLLQWLQFQRWIDSSQFLKTRATTLPALLLLCMAVLIVANNNLKEFLIGSFQVSMGYSHAMSTIGNLVELRIGFTLLFAIFVLSILTIIRNPIVNSGAVLALLLMSLVNFKHGFIRHDAHVLSFAFTFPSFLFNIGVLTFCTSFSPCSWLKLNRLNLTWVKRVWLATIAISLVFVVGLGIDNSSITKYYDFNIKQYGSENFDPKGIYHRFTLLAQPKASQNQILAYSKDNLIPSLIKSEAVLSRLKNKTVDVLPWEVSVIEANQLKWHPSPIFQTYSAYTRWLDRKNLKLYQQDPPERIIYNLLAIDGRHPYFEQPLTNLFRLCHYQPFKLRQQSIDSIGEIAVLKPKETPLCSLDNTTAVGELITVGWGDEVDLDKIRAIYNEEPGNLLLVRANIHHSIFGKLYSFLLRTPPVNINVAYRNNQQGSYRLLIDNAKDSIIIGNLPTNSAEMHNDFYGYDTLNPVTSIAFAAPNKAAFSPKIELQFLRLKKQSVIPKNFDPNQYLQLNPDVKEAGVDPEFHFLKYGFFEGRAFRK